MCSSDDEKDASDMEQLPLSFTAAFFFHACDQLPKAH